MDLTSPFFMLLTVITFVIWFCFYSHGRRHKCKLPSGPCPFLMVRNIFQLSGNFHSTLAKLSQTFGPLISIKLVNRTAIVVSSPKLAKELLQKYDHTFTTRLVIDAARAFDHHKFSIIWSPAGSQWRNLRKLCKEQILSSERLHASQRLRQEKVQQLCDYVRECCINGEAVDIGAAAFTTSLNFLSNTLFSVDFAHYDSNSSQEIEEIIRGILITVAKPNISDFFPVLQVIDPQGIRRQAKFYFGKLLEIFDQIISQRLQERGTSLAYSRKNDVLEHLLELNQQHEAEWSYKGIKHLLLDLFIAGLDTTSLTVEWAMAELLRDPERKEIAKAEIKQFVGQHKLVQESDISKFPYLHAIVKETFRLHPAAALISRQTEADIEINHYTVPKNAQILVNLWAVGRDSSLWLNPDSFIPERFLKCEIDVKGQHFELLPFGTGRRICPGLNLAHRMVHLMVASFLHNFDWKLVDGIKPEEMDMSERLRLNVQKATPLKAIPIMTTF